MQFQSLNERKKNHRLCFLRRILQNEDRHHTLPIAYDKIARGRQLATVTTRAAARGEPNFHNHQEKLLPLKFPATDELPDQIIPTKSPLYEDNGCRNSKVVLITPTLTNNIIIIIIKQQKNAAVILNNC